ncbi:hypothetical protein PIB30_052140 [Stylosanthes scabra]|uniref:Myb/SANT-like domain-containing protein n=1 Tax=Stylosanthes scabra TaxID=79078 RepID=A0ABU6XGB9_9FABA|nr:hypothetical protein [Stylosanthes scabra]
MVLAKELESKSGIGWNETTKTFEATSDVWKALIKSNPKLRQIRGKYLHHLNILRDIYEKDIATGDRSGTAKERLQG